nr:hypothetical protein [Tanacetum cinerariifolium]
GSMQQSLNELTAFCTSLQREHSELLAKFQAQKVEINRLKDRVKNLEDQEGVIGDKSRDDALIKGRSTNEGEAPAERISNDSEEIARVLTSMDATTVPAGETNVPTGSGSIPTAGPPATIVSTGSEVGPTASPIGEGSGTPTEPHHTPFPEAAISHPTTSSIPLSSIPTAPIPPVTQPDITPIRQYTRRARIAQSSALPTVADEHASLMRDVSKGEACPTDSGFIADQDMATIAKSFTLPYDSAPRVNVLEDKEDVAVTQSGDDAPIKGRSINEGEAAAKRISNDSEEVARVLTSMDATTVLAGGIDVSTGSGSIPTAGPPATIISTGSEVGPTASPIVTRRKGKEVMIARDAEVARIHTEEELQGMIDSLDKSNETIAKYLQEYQDFASELPLEKRIELISDLVKYQDNYSKQLGWWVKDFKGMTFKEIEAKFAEVWKHVENFISMGSKEETKRLKRKGLNLEQEQVKKQKSSEEALEFETSTEEFTKEKIKEMMQLVPVEDVYVQALQVKHPIIDWKVHTEGQRSYWQIIRLGGKWKLYDLSGVHHLNTKDREIFMLVEKDYPLRKGLALVMISYKLQVENYSQMAEDLIRKIYNIANTPRRSIKFRGGLLGIKCTRHSHCQVKCSHWQYKFPLPVKVVATARSLHCY